MKKFGVIVDPVLILVFLAVFIAGILLSGVLFKDDSGKYKKRALADVSRENVDYSSNEEISGLIEEESKFNLMMDRLPLIGFISRQLRFSGATIGLIPYLMLLVFAIAVGGYAIGLMFDNTWALGGIISFAVIMVLNIAYLSMKVEKRNTMILNKFPDAIDVIVRSVKSGHPLIASLRMIVQSADPEIAREFRKVVDEVSFGRPLPVALRKMSERIGLMDVNFFVVVLSVQQETGGNLAEVLNNLSNIIRKRKQLRQKIQAMTSEGRFTGWVFGAIPILTLVVVYFMSPTYLDPIRKTELGHNLFIISFGLIAASIFLSNKICKIDI